MIVDQGSAILPQTIKTFEEERGSFVAICQQHVKDNFNKYFNRCFSKGKLAHGARHPTAAERLQLRRNFDANWAAVLNSYSEEGASVRFDELCIWCDVNGLGPVADHLRNDLVSVMPRLCHWKKGS